MTIKILMKAFKEYNLVEIELADKDKEGGVLVPGDP